MRARIGQHFRGHHSVGLRARIAANRTGRCGCLPADRKFAESRNVPPACSRRAGGNRNPPAATSDSSAKRGRLKNFACVKARNKDMQVWTRLEPSSPPYGQSRFSYLCDGSKRLLGPRGAVPGLRTSRSRPAYPWICACTHAPDVKMLWKCCARFGSLYCISFLSVVGP